MLRVLGRQESQLQKDVCMFFTLYICSMSQFHLFFSVPVIPQTGLPGGGGGVGAGKKAAKVPGFVDLTINSKG